MESSIAFRIEPRAKDLGDGFFVRRALPYAKKRMVGPFIFWDHMGPAELGAGQELVVRAHPHIGLATITYLFSGEILHRDSLGNEQWIRPGEVNWMTAGSGIVHSERAQPAKPQTLEGIQLWVALPRQHEKVDPSFFHGKFEDLPTIDMNGAQLRLIAGQALGKSSPIPVFSDLFYLSGKSSESHPLRLDLRPEQEGALYVVRGSITTQGERFERFSLVVFKPGEPLEFTPEPDSEFMIFGGECFPESREIWWNFVASDPKLIEEAKIRWRENRFPPVPQETDRIPLPQ